MTEQEKQANWDKLQEKLKSERELLTHNGVFSEEQAKILQAYLSMYYYKQL